MVKKIWNSLTVATWMSYSTKALTLFGVLPLILKRFSEGDIVLWYMFATIISLQSLADFGFRQTFSRIISFAYSGGTDVYSSTGQVTSDQGINTSFLKDILFSMRYLYLRLTIMVFFLTAIVGTWFMYKPITNVINPQASWYSWLIILITTSISFYGKVFMNFLEGVNQILIVRRIETLTSLGTILSSIAVLLYSPSLFLLVLVNQLWVIIVVLRDWYLYDKIKKELNVANDNQHVVNRLLIRKIWSPAWRSGISGLMSIGLTNVTSLIYAQIGSTSSIASFLLANRVMNQLREISMAPFYSKLPMLAILRIKNNLKDFIKISQRGMLISNITFIVGFVIIGIYSTSFLHMLHSETTFVSPLLWLLMGIAFFVHRFGAMHIQVYISTNHIISHIADGISGLLFIVSAFLLSHVIGLYAIPVGMLVGYLGFYAWYAAKKSYLSMNISFWKFEKKASLLPIILLSIYLVWIFVIKNLY